MKETGPPPSGGELQALQDELADARAEAERLREDGANAAARAVTAEQEAAALRDEASSLRDEVHAHRAAVEAAQARVREAAAKYRDLVVRTEPALPAELIAGDDVEAVEASAASVRELVSRVREQIAAEGEGPTAARAAPAGARVPAGAPARSAPDTSSLSPEQKIRIGLARRAT